MLEPLSIPELKKPLPRLVQGTLHLGRLSIEAAEALLDAAFELGVRAFDTAPVYGNGLSERRVGAWLTTRKHRDQVVLIGKGCHPDERGPRLDPAALDADLERSRTRLGVEFIDLYLLHRDDPTQPVEPIVEALNRHVESGRIRAFGASNWSLQRILEANAFAVRQGLQPFSLSSPGLSLVRAERTWPGCVAFSLPEDAAQLDGYRRARLPLLVWSPLGGGYLGGLASPGATDEGEARRVRDFYDSPSNRARLERATLLAERHSVSVAALGLAYVFSLDLVASLVLGCRDRSELLDCCGALAIELSPAELSWLEGGGGDLE